jgi:hypothetical protein
MPGGVAGERPVKAVPYADLLPCLQLQVPMILKGRCTCIRSGMSRHLIQA